MQPLVIKEKLLFGIRLLIATIFWFGVSWLLKLAAERYLPMFGIDHVSNARLLALLLLVLILLLIGYFIYMAKQAAFLRGHAVEISEKQLPDLHTRLLAACERLGIDDVPLCYLVSHKRYPRTHHLRYQGEDLLLLNSDLVNAFSDRQGAVDFLIGYELASIHDPINKWRYFLWPTEVLPLLGPGAARMQIYRYDMTAINACHTKVDAAFALAIGASGAQRWKSLNIPHFASQSADISQFWMALFELLADMPWSTKRMARLRGIATHSDSFIPRRHPLAFVIAVFIPYANLRRLAGLRHLVFLILWLSVIVFWGALGLQQARQHDLFGLFGTPTTLLPDSEQAQVHGKVNQATKQNSNPYRRLHADLKALGQLALSRYKIRGGVPCELGNVASIYLNYQSNRYAFSCDEPIVYTLVARGEFEPGRAAHLQSYNWQSNKIIMGPAP